MTSTDLMNVQAFENMVPSTEFAALNPQDESLADGIGSSYGIIGYKGKVWTLRLRGETYTFVRPDDGSPAAFLDVIVLRSASYKSKSYYPANSFNDNSSGERPVCAALDGVTPDRDVQQAQSTACAICPRNEWKMVGDRKGRECSDYKRLAVLILPSQSKALLGSALMEPVFLRVPAASLNDLAILGEAMSKKGFHYSTYITRIGFQMDKPHPQMTFRALQPLTGKEAPIVMPMREDPQAYRITGENEIGKGGNGNVVPMRQHSQPVAQQPRQQPQQVAQAPVTATVNQTPAPSPDAEIAALQKKLADAQAKAAAAQAAQTQQVIPPQPTQAQKPPTEVVGLGSAQPTIDVDTGFGDVSGAGNASTTNSASATVNTAEDTGPAEDADVDLDARVAGLLQR